MKYFATETGQSSIKFYVDLYFSMFKLRAIVELEKENSHLKKLLSIVGKLFIGSKRT